RRARRTGVDRDLWSCLHGLALLFSGYVWPYDVRLPRTRVDERIRTGFPRAYALSKLESAALRLRGSLRKPLRRESRGSAFARGSGATRSAGSLRVIYLGGTTGTAPGKT